MSDDADKCNHPLPDGGTCDNPATDGDTCWIPSHGGDAENGHRPTKFTQEKADRAKDAARKGMSKAGCARSVGVDKATLQRWLDKHDGFRNAFTRARSEGEEKLVTGPLYDREDEPDMDGQHARFLLSTSFEYVKTEKQEVEDVSEGENGFGTNIIVSGEYAPEQLD